jgi:CheY-like chemotaxis protein
LEIQTLPPPEALLPVTAGLSRILVVDDNHDAANSLVMLLRCLGYEARAAYDGQDALDAAEEFAPRIVLLDLRLPVIDGYEVARRLRRTSLPINMLVAVSGLDGEETAARVRSAGFDCHLVKPVDPVRLEKLLAAAVGV